MSKSENLCSLRIGAIDEDDRRKVINQRESTKLLWVEFSVRVASNHSVYHNQYPVSIGLIKQPSQCITPAHAPAGHVEVENHTHMFSGLDDVDAGVQGADEWNRFFAIHSRVVAIPLLPLLALIHRIEKVGAGPIYGGVTHGPEIWNRHGLFGWCWKEEEPNRRVSRLSKLLKLLEGWLYIAAFPRIKSGKARREVFKGES